MSYTLFNIHPCVVSSDNSHREIHSTKYNVTIRTIESRIPQATNSVCIMITINHQLKAGILYCWYPSLLLAPYKEVVVRSRECPVVVLYRLYKANQNKDRPVETHTILINELSPHTPIQPSQQLYGERRETRAKRRPHASNDLAPHCLALSDIVFLSISIQRTAHN